MKVISAMLRHSSTTITSDTYTSILLDVAREAAEAVAMMVLRAVGEGVRGTGGLPTGSQAPRVVFLKLSDQAKDQVNEGAPGRIRTCDARFRKPMLYPLSYEGWTLVRA
jgi:hypothetical protein